MRFWVPPVFVDLPFRAVAREAQARRVGARHGHQWCHMWSDDVEALHAMAAAIGMRREWFQDGRFPHYDLVPSRRARAISLGAVERSFKDYLRERKAVSEASSNPSTM